jgi:exodeoxyribonuclease VII large subunit
MVSSRRFEALQFDLGLAEGTAPEAVDETAVPASRAYSAGEPEAPAIVGASGDLIDMVARVKALARASENIQVRVPGSTPDDALSVGEFYERVRNALRNEFPADIWVTGEVRKVTVVKGNRYLELADRHGSSDRAAATIDVACWYRDWPHIGAELQAVGVELAAGLVVRIRGRVAVWEGAAKIRFNMTDLDVEALVGGIAAARRRLLATLQQEGVLQANKRLPAPLVPLRVGVVTSAGGEAYRDFTGALKGSGYAFDVRLESTLVQGQDAAAQIARAIRRLHAFEPHLIVVVRGGGAKGDLAAFDSEAVARAIVASRVPVWTGVGHTGDLSVADEVAQRSCITPTACGQAVVAAVREYAEGIEARAAAVAAKGRAALERSIGGVQDRRARLGRAARHELDRAASDLVLARSRTRHGAVVVTERHASNLSLRSQRVSSLARHGLQGCQERLSNQKAMLQAFDPRRQMARGWSLTRGADGRLLRSAADVAEGEELVTILGDGTVTSRVESWSSQVPLASLPEPGGS